jgi:hypothetical protein
MRGVKRKLLLIACLLFISNCYAQTITITGINPSSQNLCPGFSFGIDLSTTGFSGDNLFQAYLSDQFGSFVNGTLINSNYYTGNPTEFSTYIPDGTVAGTGYLVMVTQSSIQSQPFSISVTQTFHPNGPITGPDTVCIGSVVSYSASFPPGPTQFAWVFGGYTPNEWAYYETFTPNIQITIPSNAVSSDLEVFAVYNGCPSHFMATFHMTIWPSLNSYTVTGGGAYCNVGGGVPIGLSSSQSGVAYQLYRNSSIVGAPVIGTGSAISFPNQTATGTYTVRASSGGGCNLTMTGNAIVTINPPITTQSSSLTFTNVTSNSVTVNWTNGNGSRRIVKIKPTNTFSAPVNGNDYTANSVYSGSGEQVVYNGTGSSVTVTGLLPSHWYWFRVYDASCSSSSSLYLTSAGPGNPRRVLTQPYQIPNRPEASTAPAKGLYVNGFASILGNQDKEDSLLRYARQNGFTYLALYELHIVHAAHDLTTVPTSQVLADFIAKAKNQYGIAEVGAVGENAWWFNNIIHVYNSIHPSAAEQFDVYNLEFEFWNTISVGPGDYYCTTYLQPAALSCDTAGAFAFWMQQLTSIDSLAALDGVKSEVYVGWFTQGQALQMIAKADRILLHSYVSNVNNVYGYTQTRLSYFGSGATVVDVMPIFSSEPSFLGPWLSTHVETGAYDIYSSAFANETGAWKSNINLQGYQWFAYSYMPYPLPTEVDELSMSSIIIHPNPTTGLITISLPNPSKGGALAAPIQKLTLYSSDGRVVKSVFNILLSTFNLDMSDLSAGIYFLDCQTVNGGEKVKVVKY